MAGRRTLAVSEAARGLLIALDLFVAVTAIGGGIALVTGLEGDRFSPNILRNTPFRGFIGPGLILAIAVGGSAAVATAFTISDRGAGGILSILAGAVLMGFISIEAHILADQDGWSKTEVVYFTTGLLMAVLGAIVWAG